MHKPLSKEKLEKLSTQRLLQVLRIARIIHEGLYCSCCQLPLWETDRFYSEKEWKQNNEMIEKYLADIKNVLSGREHLEKK
ncbi:MAG: hypothetical protein WC761_01665 [Candidatus Paceibacterota bacterium]|jgi:hypothetical protein